MLDRSAHFSHKLFGIKNYNFFLFQIIEYIIIAKRYTIFLPYKDLIFFVMDLEHNNLY